MPSIILPKPTLIIKLLCGDVGRRYPVTASQQKRARWAHSSAKKMDNLRKMGTGTNGCPAHALREQEKAETCLYPLSESSFLPEKWILQIEQKLYRT
jgi:hypothetical protein